ncbi:MAG: SDR family NAD(P)-dependent oxidoreductase [bacterium]|nr:SDR family NAD(P)-dependent oxidoreductase [bacterium]
MARLSKLDRSVAGRVAVVTGAASGMGRATAWLLADEGAKVAALDVNRPGVEETVAAIVDAGGTALAVACDLSDPDVVEPVVEQVRAELGPVDILINNAGIAAGAPLDASDFEDAWAASMEVNVTAQMRMVRACLEDLKRNGDGRIVNVASTEGVMATPNNSPYTVSKHGVVGLTRALAVELGQFGLTANAICPGPIRTAMTGDIPEEAKRKYARRRVPARRYGDPEEVAQVTLSLVLPAASFINGAVVLVDGGLHAKSN